MKDSYKNVLKVFFFALVGFIVLYFVYKSNNESYQAYCLEEGIASADCSLFDKVVADVKSANYFWVLVSLILFTLSNVSRALRWHIMLEPLGYKPRFFNSLASILVAYLSNLGLPRSGEFVRAGILSKYENYSADKVMGTIVLDRVSDVAMLLIVLVLTIFLSYNDFYAYLSENMELGGKLSSLLSSIVFMAFVVFALVIGVLGYIYRDRILKSTIGSKILSLGKGLLEGVLSITKLSRPWAFVGHSIFIWLCYFGMTWVVFFAFEPTSHLGPVSGLVIFVFGTLGIVFPSPGGMGSYHYLVGEGLGLYGIAEADAFSFANIIFFSVQLFCNVLLGILALILLPIMNTNKDGEA